jgi:hypothetical protein
MESPGEQVKMELLNKMETEDTDSEDERDVWRSVNENNVSNSVKLQNSDSIY